MADFDFKPKPICHECQNIDWEQVAHPKGYRLHQNLVDLGECGKHCGLCWRAYELVEEEFRETWRNLTSEDGHLFQMQYFVAILDSEEQGSRVAPARNTYIMVSKSGSLFAASNFQTTLENRRIPWMHAWALKDRVFGFDPFNASPMLSRIPRISKLPRDTASQSSIDKACTWFKECIEGIGIHTREPATANSERPGRLIHIRGEEGCQYLSLVEGRGCQGSYAALSYCWGHSLAPWKTLRSNIKERFMSLPVSDLPLTLLQAVEIISRLGLHYLWIDSICIVQDNFQDWEAEAIKCLASMRTLRSR